MSRLRLNNVGDPLGSVNPITVSSATATSCSWSSAPTGMPTLGISLPDYLPVTAEPGTTSEETFWIIGYTSGATTALILRDPPEGNTGTPAAHSSKPWAHSPTQHDFHVVRSTAALSKMAFR